MRNRSPRNEIAKQLGVHPYFLDDTIKQAKSYTEAEINHIFELSPIVSIR